MTTRDGIVGTYVPPGGDFKHHEIGVPGDHKNLKLWAPWVRALVFDFALAEPLQFVLTKDTPPRASLWHRDPIDRDTFATIEAGAGGANVPIFWMTRPTEQQFKRQLVQIIAWADLRADRQGEILAQIGDVFSFFQTIAFLDWARTPMTMELIGSIWRTTVKIEMRFKHAMAVRRPHELSAQVQPMIPTPNHSAYPSGHATEAHVIAFTLATLINEASGTPGLEIDATKKINQLRILAHRIANNRTIAGVHYPVDSRAGAHLGLTLGRYFVDRMKASSAGAGIGNWVSRSFDPGGFFANPPTGDDPGPDFTNDRIWDLIWQNTGGVNPLPVSGDDGVLGELWKLAREEWV